MQIKTNNTPRAFIYAADLTSDEHNQFDYLTNDEIMDTAFIRYKGQCYALNDLMRTNVPNWDAAESHTVYSGVLFRLVDNGDAVICASYYC